MRIDGQPYRRTDMTVIIAAFCDIANASETNSCVLEDGPICGWMLKDMPDSKTVCVGRQTDLSIYFNL
jgi:hypothetical protein